jgi:hypothetical protein
MLTHRFLIDGRVIAEGDTITSFRGETMRYEGCQHPRKIIADGHEYFPSVFNGEIQEQHGDTWVRTAF